MPGNRVNKIHYASSYLKAYRKLPRNIKEIQDKKEQQFRTNPFNIQLKTHKLKGKYRDLYSYSVNYNWRVLFRFIKNDEVIFYDIGTHDIYK